MALSTTFGPLQGPIPTNTLDTNFAEVAAMAVLNCTAAGTNTIILTPRASQSVLAAYFNGFIVQWVAQGTNTGVATINVNALGPKIVYKDTSTGPTILSGGEITQNNQYLAVYDSAINSGNGGFHLLSLMGTGGGGSGSGGGAWQFIGTTTVTGGGSIQLTNAITSSVDKYVLILQGIQAGTSGAYPEVQFSVNNGSSYDTTNAYSYANWYVDWTGQTAVSDSSADSGIAIGASISTQATHTYNATITLYELQSATTYKQTFTDALNYTSDGRLMTLVGGGMYASTSAVNAVQILMNTGTITGTAVLYGIQNTNGSSGGGGSGSTGASSVIGDGRNIVCQRASNTTLTLTATEAVVKTAPGGTGYLGNSLSMTLNLGTTGVNALDTGVLTASTFYGWYFICNPTTGTFATLASKSFTSPALPTGYTAFSLMGVIPIDATTHVAAGFNQYDRTCQFDAIIAQLALSQQAALTSTSIATVVPSIAKSVSGIMGSGGAGTTYFAEVAGGSGGSGVQILVAGPSLQTSPFSEAFMFSFRDLQMLTAQTVYYACHGDSGIPFTLYVTGYSI